MDAFTIMYIYFDDRLSITSCVGFSMEQKTEVILRRLIGRQFNAVIIIR